MYNDTIKLLNLEQFKLNILKLDVSKINNVLYCHITLERIENYVLYVLVRIILLKIIKLKNQSLYI